MYMLLGIVVGAIALRIYYRINVDRGVDPNDSDNTNINSIEFVFARTPDNSHPYGIVMNPVMFDVD